MQPAPHRCVWATFCLPFWQHWVAVVAYGLRMALSGSHRWSPAASGMQAAAGHRADTIPNTETAWTGQRLAEIRLEVSGGELSQQEVRWLFGCLIGQRNLPGLR